MENNEHVETASPPDVIAELRADLAALKARVDSLETTVRIASSIAIDAVALKRHEDTGGPREFAVALVGMVVRAAVAAVPCVEGVDTMQALRGEGTSLVDLLTACASASPTPSVAASFAKAADAARKHALTWADLDAAPVQP